MVELETIRQEAESRRQDSFDDCLRLFVFGAWLFGDSVQQQIYDVMDTVVEIFVGQGILAEYLLEGGSVGEVEKRQAEDADQKLSNIDSFTEAAFVLALFDGQLQRGDDRCLEAHQRKAVGSLAVIKVFVAQEPDEFGVISQELVVPSN